MTLVLGLDSRGSGRRSVGVEGSGSDRGGAADAMTVPKVAHGAFPGPAVAWAAACGFP